MERRGSEFCINKFVFFVFEGECLVYMYIIRFIIFCFNFFRKDIIFIVNMYLSR